MIQTRPTVVSQRTFGRYTYEYNKTRELSGLDIFA
jgi:hypothetical protein